MGRAYMARRRGPPQPQVTPASCDFSAAAAWREWAGGIPPIEFRMERKTLKIKTDIYKPGGFGG